VESAKAELASAEADVEANQAEATMRSSDLDRYQKLDPRIVSEQKLDTARAAAKTANANLRASRTKELAVKAKVGEAAAQVDAATGQVDQAKLDLSYGDVKAPGKGRVTRKTVQPGQHLEVGQQLMAIVPPTFWVVANFKETQLASIRPGQEVDIEVDARRDKTYKGHVDSIQAGTGARFSLLPPENATGNYVKVVQRVAVKILFDEQPPPDLPLGPGMSVVPRVRIAAK
jgi:membrane fusion protein (multidrug efflux system)